MNQDIYKPCHSKDSTHIQSKTTKRGLSTVCTTIAHAFLPKVILVRVNKSIDSPVLTGYWRWIRFLCKLSAMLFTGAIYGIVVGFGVGWVMGWTYGIMFDDDGPLFRILSWSYYGAWIGAILISILFGEVTAASEMTALSERLYGKRREEKVVRRNRCQEEKG